MKEHLEGFIEISKQVGVFILTLIVTIGILVVIRVAKVPKDFSEYSREKASLKILESETEGYSYEDAKALKMKAVEEANKKLENLKSEMENNKKDINTLNEKLK